jgi:hypothetical protein
MKIFTLLVVCVILAAGPALADWSGRTQDNQISYEDDEYARTAKIAVDPFDNLHAIWVEDNPYDDDVHYGRSTDGGATWNCSNMDIVINIPDDNYVKSDMIDNCIDYDGNIFVVWAEDYGPVSEIWLTMSTDGGDTWSGTTDTVFVSFEGSTEENANYPSIAVDRNNVLHCVWNQVDISSGTTEIHYSRSTDAGLTWTGRTRDTYITPAGGEAAAFADIACDVWGNIFVIWKQTTGTDSVQLHYIVSHDSGNTWNNSEDIAISYPMKFANDPELAIDPVGNIHAIWRGSMDTQSPYHYEIYYTGSDDNGMTWDGLENYRRISYWQTDGNSAFNQEIGCDRWGNVFAAWNEEQVGGNSEIQISVSTDMGQTWSGETADEIISFPDGENGYRPFPAGDSQGYMHVVWTEFNGSSPDNYEVHYSKGDPYGYSSYAQLGLYPIDPPIAIPAGGSFLFSLAAVNNTGLSGQADGWLQLRLPNGNIYSPLIRARVRLDAGEVMVLDSIRIDVPGFAPVGDYTLYANLGFYPNQVFVSDSFGFTVTGMVSGGSDEWMVTGFDRDEDNLTSIPEKAGMEISAGPNPFNAQTKFNYDLPAAGDVRLTVYNVMGQKVAELVDGYRRAGGHTVTWDASGQASGIYFYRMESAGESITKKIILLK